MTVNEPILYQGDYRNCLPEIDDYSIDLVICDPPYWHHKSPGKPYNERRQCKTDSKFSNSGLYNAEGTMMREMSNFEPSNIYELLEGLSKKMKVYNAYFFCSENQVPHYCLWAERMSLMSTILVWEKPLSIINKNRFSQNLEYIVRVYDYGTALNKLDFNEYYNRVFHDAPVAVRKKRHPVEKPVSIIERILLLSSKQGDVIFDPFMGSGTTGVACKLNDRCFIGCEKDGGYFCVARQRISSTRKTCSVFDMLT